MSCIDWGSNYFGLNINRRKLPMKLLRFLTFSVAVLTAPGLWAQSATTVPEGYITLTIAAGTGTVRTLSIATGASGDTYQIIPADTLSTLIGTPGTTGILANANPLNADNLQVLVGTSWRQYYHDGTNWRRIGPNTISNDVVIRPDAAV